MNNTENLKNKEAIDKLKSLVDEITVCLFCTELKTDDGATCRPMSALKVCDEGKTFASLVKRIAIKTKRLRKIKMYNSFSRILAKAAIWL